MKKRILVATVLVLAVVLVAQTGAWAGKLQAGAEAPAMAGDAGPRPAGTGGDGADGSYDKAKGDAPYSPPAAVAEPTFTVADFSGDVPEGAPEGATFSKGTESGGDATLSKAYKVSLVDDLGLADDFKGAISYYDGTEWVELTVVGGEVTLPAGAPNPVFLAVVE